MISPDSLKILSSFETLTVSIRRTDKGKKIYLFVFESRLSYTISIRSFIFILCTNGGIRTSEKGVDDT